MPSLPPAPPSVVSAPAGESGIRWERAVCAICGGEQSTFQLRVSHLIYGREGSASIVRCDSCGHLYQSPRPTRDTIAGCYPSNYGPHVAASATDVDAAITPPASAAGPTGNSRSKPLPPADSRAAKEPWYLSRFSRGVPGLRSFYYWLSDRWAAPLPPPPRPGARALELGCGAGGYLDQLAACGWAVEGLEPADSPASRCRARGLAVQTGGVESADFPSGVYDLVIAWMVVEHLHDPGAALRQIHDWLRPEGTLMISVPHVASWELRLWGEYHYILNEPTHLQHFSRSGIERLLHEHGFPIRSLKFQENLYNHVGGLGIWLKSRFPSRSWGDRLLAFLDNPSMWGRLGLALPAKLMAALGQTGRMTIIADRATAPNSPAASATVAQAGQAHPEASKRTDR